jgi:preprotein translocase subunit SecF
MKHGKILILYTLLIVLIVSGCNMANTNNEKEDLNISKVTSKETINQSTSNQVKELLKKEKEVSDVKAVNLEKELLIDVEIKQMDRFQLEEIEKRLKKITEEKYPNHKVTLSTDKKIFLELDELEKQVIEKNMSKKKLEKELKRIKSLSEEQT